MTNSYKTGTVSVTNGSAVVNGTGTAWAIENVVGGMFRLGTFEAEIITATNTQLTLDTNYTGATASGQAYRIWLQDAQAASNITINRQLGAIIARLVDSAPEIQDFLDAATPGDALSALGVSGFIQTLLNDANQATALATLGANNASNLNTGIVPEGVLPAPLNALSANVKTLLGTANFAAFRTSLSVKTQTEDDARYAQLSGAAFSGSITAVGDILTSGSLHANNGAVYLNAANTAYLWWNGTGYHTHFGPMHHDGNAARKPQTAAGNGQFVSISTTDGVGYTLPSGGTWLWWGCQYLTASGAIASAAFTGINAGGTFVLGGDAGYILRGFAWRISE